jgi:hypothetical protein
MKYLGGNYQHKVLAKEMRSHFDRDSSTIEPHFIPSKLDYSKITNINFQGL